MDETMISQNLLTAFRNGNLLPERSGAYWEQEERSELQRLYQEGTGISQIALTLQRSEIAVIQQLAAMQLLTPPNKVRIQKPRSVSCLCQKCSVPDCPHRFEGK